MDTKELLERFSRVASPSGYEYMAEPDLRKIIEDGFGGVFDEVRFDKFGSCRLIKRAAPEIENPRKIMLDAHLDQIGLVVTEILEGGFLRVKPLGGIDGNILSASEFYVYTYEEAEPFIFVNSPERKIMAVAASVPPHLKKTSGNNLPPIEDIYLDAGFNSKEELEKIVRVGSPVTFKSEFLELENGLVSCAGMDDRLCAAIIMTAIQSLQCAPAVEVHAVLSVSEETHQIGASTAAFDIRPEFAVILDVDFSRDPGIDAAESIETGKGAGITYSAMTNIKLTKKIIELAKEKNIPTQITASPTSTGTNADIIQITAEGIPCAVVSIPLKNMHTFNEVCSIGDVESIAGLIREIIENAEGLM